MVIVLVKPFMSYDSSDGNFSKHSRMDIFTFIFVEYSKVIPKYSSTLPCLEVNVISCPYVLLRSLMTSSTNFSLNCFKVINVPYDCKLVAVYCLVIDTWIILI